jgi:acetylornithine deacetylase/succinyl-diaminopimelate desuccinylase-like protein
VVVTCAAASLQVGTGGLSRLITWRGSDSSLLPVLFVSHVDVVPVTQETLQVWLTIFCLPRFVTVVLINKPIW